MTRLGMDTEAVRQCAAQLDLVAGQLASIASNANTIVGTFAHHWDGGDAEALSRAWQHQHRATVFALSEHVHKMATTARAEADQQDTASAAGSGPAGSGAGTFAVPGAHPPSTFDRFNSGVDTFGQVYGLPGDVHDLAGAWRSAPDFQRWLKHVPNLEKSMQHTETGAAHAISAVRHYGREAADHLHISAAAEHAAGKVVGHLGDAAALYTAGVGAYAAGRDLALHHYGAFADDAAGLASSGLKSTGNPTAYLGGVVVAEYTDVVHQAGAIDWHQGLPSLTPSNIYHIYGPALADSVASMPSHIWKWIS